MANWIFQGVPSRYDTLGDFERGEPPTSWSIGRHRDDLVPGDRAALWVGGRDRPGVYALGIIDGAPFRGIAGHGWTEADVGREFWFCPIALDRIFASEPIPRSVLRNDPRFSGARILTQPWAPSPFWTTDEEWAVLEELAAQRQPGSVSWLSRPAENVWLEIQDKARRWQADQTPVYTLHEHVRNFIVGVTDTEIARQSDRGRSDDQTRIPRGQVQRIWQSLTDTGQAPHMQGVLRFAYALVAAAIDGISFRSGPFCLVVADRAAADRPFVPGTPLGVRPSRLGRRPRGRTGGGEGPVHAAIKNFIKNDPVAALGEALTYVTEDLAENLGAEVRFITGDRVDLLMKDENGRYVVIEVEPQIGPADNIGFHQAGKYRTLVAMEKRLRPGQVRAIVAASSIDEPLAEDYARLYGIEPRVITLPSARAKPRAFSPSWRS
jgi:hypothetical protein